MTKLRIFYTDDDEDDQLLFTEIIKNIDKGHQVLLQSHGAELIDVLKENTIAPDLVFLDLNMPHKNGMQVLKEMKDDDDLSKLPVVIFSTSNNLENVEYCKELGANGYICKPTSFTDMRKIFEKVLEMDWHHHGKKKNEFFFIHK